MKKGSQVWIWKKINSNYILVHDQFDRNRAAFKRERSIDPWVKLVRYGRVPFNVDSPEFIAQVPKRSPGGQRIIEREPYSTIFSIRMDETSARLLREHPDKERIRFVLHEFLRREYPEEFRAQIQNALSELRKNQ